MSKAPDILCIHTQGTAVDQYPGPALEKDLGTQDPFVFSGDRLLAQVSPLSQRTRDGEQRPRYPFMIMCQVSIEPREEKSPGEKAGEVHPLTSEFCHLLTISLPMDARQLSPQRTGFVVLAGLPLRSVAKCTSAIRGKETYIGGCLRPAATNAMPTWPGKVLLPTPPPPSINTATFDRVGLKSDSQKGALFTQIDCRITDDFRCQEALIKISAPGPV
ncbi:hypothetical protein E5288_WYG012905 [Bos mutus]|uniref:Uncharacterized protein n=1 Tax=Bos mutus TaxID=72004 RepID=A0A6B0QU29_9CETA|nr:hypothetical protein [Bos mutus]